MSFFNYSKNWILSRKCTPPQKQVSTKARLFFVNEHETVQATKCVCSISSGTAISKRENMITQLEHVVDNIVAMSLVFRTLEKYVNYRKI